MEISWMFPVGAFGIPILEMIMQLARAQWRQELDEP